MAGSRDADDKQGRRRIMSHVRGVNSGVCATLAASKFLESLTVEVTVD